MQLRFASGSLAQFLDVRYSAKVPSSSIVDDAQGTLEKYIPDDYYRTESEFLARVEEDAVSFRPPGEKVASYTRIAPDSKKKGKGTVVTLPEDDPDTIVYEVWHVRFLSPPPPSPFRLSPSHLFDNCLRQSGTLQDSKNITGGCNCSFCSTSRLALTSMMRKIHGSLLFCGFLSAPVHILMCVCVANENRYEKRKRRTTPVTETYHFVGYSSLYPFYCFPDKVRLRLRSVIPLYFFRL